MPGDDIKRLINDLTSADYTVAMEAAHQLGLSGDLAAVAGLCSVLLGGHEWVAVEAAEALGKIGNPSAVPTLLEALRADTWLAEYDDMAAKKQAIPLDEHMGGAISSIRMAAARALGQIGDPRAVQGLIRAVHPNETDGAVRRVSLSALKKFDTPEAKAAVEEWQLK
nr:HEAT repeat domain-containing protein [Anaerolineae bacterium]